MHTIKVIEFPGYEELKNNFSIYKDIFINDAIIAFRNANLDYDMQAKVMHLFGDNLNWYPNSLNSNPSDYIEDHHKHMDSNNIVEKDSIMLGWHQEHIAQEHNPYVSGVWNMTLFKCNPETGKTYFIDMSRVFNMFNDEDREFMLNCKVNIINYRWFKDKAYYYYIPEKNKLNNKDEDVVYSLVSEHWLTKEKTIRTYLSRDETTELYKFKDKDPSENDIKKYIEISKKINDIVNNNEDVRMQHIWQQGDLLIPDLFKLAHAVSGGFDKDQRRLDGMFGTLKPWPVKPN
jgi:alpha-ketoglutarate-dependent taurine dioxygenase